MILVSGLKGAEVVLGVHFPSDVLAGATLGLLVASPLVPLPAALVGFG